MVNKGKSVAKLFFQQVFFEKCVCSIDSLGNVKKAGGSSMRVFPLDQVEKMYTEYQKYLEEFPKDL